MSTRKGNAGRHNNTFAFRHNPHSKKTEKILGSPNEGVCHGCWEMIEWRKQYRKYKPLKVPGRCDVCHLKTVRLAYHTVCQPCTDERGKCAKCGKEPVHHPYHVIGAQPKEDEERVLLLKMTERQRRTYFRELEREQNGRKKKAADSDPELSDDSDDEDDLGDMPAPPQNKFDPDMLVKERAARAGTQTEEGKKKDTTSEDDEDQLNGSDDLDGSAESYEDDSDELDRVDAEAEKLVGNRDPAEAKDDEDDLDEDAGSDEEDAGAGSDDE